METANIQSKDILLAYHISGTPSLTFIVSSHPYRVYRIIYLPRLSLLLCNQSTCVKCEKQEQLGLVFLLDRLKISDSRGASNFAASRCCSL